MSKLAASDSERVDQAQGDVASKRASEPTLKSGLQLKDRDSPPLLNNNSPGGQAATKAQGKQDGFMQWL